MSLRHWPAWRTLLALLAGAIAALGLAAFLATRYLPSVDLRGARFSFSAAPLPVAEVEGRLKARLFAADFAERIEATADRIAQDSNDPDVKANALRWKLGALESSTRAGLQPSAHLALVDSWALSLQMLNFLLTPEGIKSLGARHPQALALARSLAQEAEALAARHLPARALAVYRPMVSAHVQKAPMTDLSLKRASIAMDWLAAAAQVDGVPTTLGSASDVAADAIDRADAHLRHLPRALRWRSELSLTENREALAEIGGVVDDTIREARSNEAGMTPAVVAAAAQRLARSLGWVGLHRFGGVLTQVLTWVGLAALALGGLGFGLGWLSSRAWARRQARRAPIQLSPGLSSQSRRPD